MFTGEEIIKRQYKNEIFKDNVEYSRKQYAELLKTYNRKLNNKENFIKATKKTTNLYKVTPIQLNDGTGHEKGIIKVKNQGNREYIIPFRSKKAFKLGEMYIGDNSVLYLINEKYDKLVNNALDKINSLKFTNDYMRKEFEKCLPRNEFKFKSTNGKTAVVFKKDVELISLREALKNYNNQLSVISIITILSDLYNLCCFMEFNGISHNGITIDSYFVSTKNKGGALLGGWWYSTKKGEKFSIDALNKKEINFDLKSIRYLGRVLLGDTEKSVGNIKRKVPKELLTWVRGKAENDAFYEYRRWKETIRKIAYERKK